AASEAVVQRALRPLLVKLRDQVRCVRRIHFPVAPPFVFSLAAIKIVAVSSATPFYQKRAMCRGGTNRKRGFRHHEARPSRSPACLALPRARSSPGAAEAQAGGGDLGRPILGGFVQPVSAAFRCRAPAAVAGGGFPARLPVAQCDRDL